MLRYFILINIMPILLKLPRKILYKQICKFFIYTSKINVS